MRLFIYNIVYKKSSTEGINLRNRFNLVYNKLKEATFPIFYAENAERRKARSKKYRVLRKSQAYAANVHIEVIIQCTFSIQI